VVGAGGQAVFAWVHGVLLGSVYVRPDDTTREQAHVDIVQGMVAAGADSMPWMVQGDWNQQPDECPIVPVLERLRGQVVVHREPEDGAGGAEAGAPTRWGGRRVIDWTVTSLGSRVKDAQLGLEAIADHRVLLSHVLLGSPPGDAWRLAPVERWERPPWLNREGWGSMLADEWRGSKAGDGLLPTRDQGRPSREAGDASVQSTVDGVWAELTRRLRRVYWGAVEVAVADAQPESAAGRREWLRGLARGGGRAKGGGGAWERMPGAYRHAESRHQPFRLRRLRNECARLREAVRQEVQEGGVRADLARRLGGCGGLDRRALRARLAAAEAEREAVEYALQADRLTSIEGMLQG
jgi:hypothetical protein